LIGVYFSVKHGITLPIIVTSVQNTKVKSVLLRAKQAHRGGRPIVLPILNLGAKRGWVVNATPRQPKPLTPLRERDPEPTVLGAESDWAGVNVSGKHALTGVRTPKRPSRSESLY
jgi:hypothetical protein